jgi:adenylosuccinate lyase
MLALPGGEEGHAAPGRVSPQRAADVEMAAALALARLGVALAQAAGDLADQRAHLLHLARLDAGKRRIAQDLVAQVLGLLAAVEQQRLRDRVADGAA